MSDEEKAKEKTVRVIMKTLNGPYKTVGYMRVVGLPAGFTDTETLTVLQERVDKKYLAFAIDQPDGETVMCMRDIENAPYEESGAAPAAKEALAMLDLLLKKGEHE